MSNSHEQSLNENVVFLPVDKSSPEFLHCETEREAVERLLSGGPEAFYSSVSSEHAACFLSPEEVSQIRSWAQNYHVKELHVEEQNGVENSFETEDFCSTYAPCHSDAPIPNLELGWPVRSPTVKTAEVMVYTSPPVEGEPPVREIIRRYLQNATQAVGIVTDKLTDNAIIGDLHTAASRGVPVYIVLNQRSLQENFTLHKLRHPNMRVRVLRGKTFCSRNGKMVVGEMKVNFLLVDLETVIHGSYSLTWTDAHLHQQLITVLRGPVVDSFDMEFRMLYAASLPAPDTCRAPNSGQLYVAYHQPQVFSDFRFSKHFLVEPEMTNPPSPPEDVLLDWEEMGVVHKDISNPNSPLDLNEEMGTEKMTEQNNNRDRVIMGRFTFNGHRFEDERRINESTSAVTARLEDNSTTSSHTESLSSNTSSAERIMRMERKVEKRLSKEFSEEDYERARISVDEVLKATTASFKSRQHLKWETFLEEESTTAAATEEITASSRKPVILKVSNTENFSSLSDIMKRIKQGPTGLLGRNVKSTMSDRTRSMMDLSDYNANINHKVETEVPAPRFPGNLDPDHMTPALALMKKRNNAVKSSLSRPLLNFTHLERTHSSSYVTDIIQWKSRYNKDEELENK